MEAEVAPCARDVAYRAQHVVDRVSWHVQIAGNSGIQGGPEAIASQSMPYIQGWMDAVTEVQPELLEPMGAELSQLLCEDNPNDAERLVVARMVLHAGPRMLSAGPGLRCALRHEQREDVVLWAFLDAWAAARLPSIPEWEAWQARATDPRTARRFRSRESRRDRLPQPATSSHETANPQNE
ncbi:MAG: hypothetical protein K8H88_06980 [Sandaracinaceae bacterium]|nr:hypothetical protein [Sandaracinaceae bacterium]